ncbi:hem oxygenase-like protein [Kalmanozyma brasiliensis GHG001]|uniref:heme oxygenase (biliverdin-producing) n=1 Tax=Kalmanozyma brasiliensis (strain GHG001) TaxID=1365824 RepID=V5E8R3_KALBG|nr:hem oxygenase-like protein [Kalmanozyma brasiliensis GHG001]EST06711.1 hem oxygenase-like protein [Kalmanozyma brasiliensis GHG001]
MTCPFAKFATILALPASAKHASSYHSLPPHSSPSSLSDALRIGTSSAHRAVEKSRGVSLLLSSLSSSPSTSELTFDRVDYVRFNIMLLCVYAAMEAGLVRGRGSEGLRGLWGDEGLIEELVRTRALLDDVRAHLDTVEAHMGASLADLADQARDSHSLSASAAVKEDIEDPSARTELLALSQAALPDAIRPTASTTQKVTEDHIALLTPAQVHSTLAYVRVLLNAHPTLLVAHAYTRYLGDLSGGQHIVRKVSKRFPTTTPNDGFAFYHFAGTDLKARFRVAMEQAVPEGEKSQQVVQELVREANTAFDLNTGLFESLLPAELRMVAEEEVTEKVSVVTAKRWKGERVVRGLVVVGSAAVMAHTLLRVGAAYVAANSATVAA